jgi:hypothetical protein
MKPILIVALLGNIAASTGQLPASPQNTNASQTLFTQFLSAPFPHASRADGHKYKDEFFPADKHYADSTVAMFVPGGFDDKGLVDFVIHFHGWRNTVGSTLEQFNLTNQFTASGRNAILIVPEGPRNAPDSSGGKLEDPDGFKRFMDEAVAVLKRRGVIKTNSTVGKIILSGHSGGYKVMSSIVERGGIADRIREVWLFDGLYGQGEKFLAWSQKPNGRLLNIYTDNGGTKTRTEEMMAELREHKEIFLATTDMAVTLSELTTNRFVFLHSDMTHNDVIMKRRTFQKFLETSCLEKLPGD